MRQRVQHDIPFGYPVQVAWGARKCAEQALVGKSAFGRLLWGFAAGWLSR